VPISVIALYEIIETQIGQASRSNSRKGRAFQAKGFSRIGRPCCSSKLKGKKKPRDPGEGAAAKSEEICGYVIVTSPAARTQLPTPAEICGYGQRVEIWSVPAIEIRFSSTSDEQMTPARAGVKCRSASRKNEHAFRANDQ
jgi:hypothetical protein